MSIHFDMILTEVSKTVSNGVKKQKCIWNTYLQITDFEQNEFFAFKLKIKFGKKFIRDKLVIQYHLASKLQINTGNVKI